MDTNLRTKCFDNSFYKNKPEQACSWRSKSKISNIRTKCINGRSANVFEPAQQQRGGGRSTPPWRKKFYIFRNLFYYAMKMVL